MKIKNDADAIRYLGDLSKVGHQIQVRFLEYKVWVQVSKDRVSLFGYEKSLVESVKKIKEQIDSKKG